MGATTGNAAKTDTEVDEAADEAAAAAVLTGMGSEGDEGDDTRLQCEEALPADEAVAGKAACGSPTPAAFPAANSPEHHLGWKVHL